jgi:hypothetical protein
MFPIKLPLFEHKHKADSRLLTNIVLIQFVDLNTPIPIYICAALYVVMAGVAILFPFEPRGQRSS